MNIEVLKKADQANGNFNNGEILELNSHLN